MSLKIESAINEVYMDPFFSKANILKLSSKERSKYNASITYYRDLHNIEAQNFVKGKNECKLESKIEIAKAMKKEGIEINTISKLTGLKINEITKI